MQSYEIRVIRKGAGATVYECSQLNDYAAIRRAKLLGDDGDIVEVWRGLKCVFTDAPEHMQLKATVYQ